MEFLQTTLEESLEDIFKIGNKSFDGFYDKDRFLSKLSDKKYWIYLAKEKEIVGFKIFYEDEDGQLYSWLGAVKPAYRRRGIASKLMNLMIGFAVSNGYSKIKLKTHEGHPEMIALCKKFGFVEVKREPNHWEGRINKEAIFFELSLN